MIRGKLEEVVETKVTGYVLTLSLDEARALRTILGRISGDPHDTPRRHVEWIYDALYKTQPEGREFELVDGSTLEFLPFKKQEV